MKGEQKGAGFLFQHRDPNRIMPIRSSQKRGVETKTKTGTA
jgi:hypothetical protein